MEAVISTQALASVCLGRGVTKVFLCHQSSQLTGAKTGLLVPNLSLITKPLFIFTLRCFFISPSYENISGSLGGQIGLFILSIACFKSLLVFSLLFRPNYILNIHQVLHINTSMSSFTGLGGSMHCGEDGDSEGRVKCVSVSFCV